MSNIKLDNLDSSAVPFFTRFLENQSGEEVSEEELKTVSGGAGGVTTLKYPSDNEDVATKKYPSDSDEDIVVTLKYPSDSDESGTTV
ncbi:MAG TPA: microviridin/marinostatin family tricyclic proteinase inhibitor [Nostocaceae cyanobacterium]|nr:microviridin/marinostatin family tricyclic proteinase inhibitor [Nostocaceae cyanobacterium]